MVTLNVDCGLNYDYNCLDSCHGFQLVFRVIKISAHMIWSVFSFEMESDYLLI